ncbi:PIN domain-containing protein [Acidobacteria bacterium AB60]|nr:PIN domain-containing protein [Acidobacteria bacterium AB60]
MLPDVNVWVALTVDKHVHHPAARKWYEALPLSASLVFCRQTQLGLFRILSTTAVMGLETLTQVQCWSIYDQWVATGQLAWATEPLGLETQLRRLTAGTTKSPKGWMDAYLAALAISAGLTLVTFDKALAAKAAKALLLG